MDLLNASLLSTRRRFRMLVAFGLVLLVFLFCPQTPGLRAQGSPPGEYQLKAVFLFNFAQFVNWPTNEFSNPGAPMVIGILGKDPFGPALDDTVRGEQVSGHPLVIRRYEHAGDVKDCQILFISESENGRAKEDLADIKGHCMLTVGENEDFNQLGGMIRFVTQRNKIRLHINLEAARVENLTISSRLLRLADIVGPER